MKLESSRTRHVVVSLDQLGRAAMIGMLTTTFCIGGSGSGSAAGDAVHGAKVYRTCMACHLPGKNGVGPMHDGVFGNKAGSVTGYAYSDALKNSGIVWNSETLDTWLANPQTLVPGTKMSYRIGNSQDRADVIEFLKCTFTK